MAHDVFVSYSHKDKPVADAVVAGLENRGIRSWIAPRDITPGTSWGQAIIDAIEGSKVMVVILSENSNQSRQVVREVERAVAKGVIIIPFRIENIRLTGAMAYFLASEHWLDALTPPLEDHINELGNTIHLFLTQGEQQGVVERPRSPQVYPAPVLRRQQPVWRIVVLVSILVLGILALILIPRLAGAPSVALLASQTASLPPTDTQPPSTPTSTPPPEFSILGQYRTSGSAYGLFVADNMLTLANGENGLVRLQVSNRAEPKQVDTFRVSDLPAQRLVVNDQVAYVIVGDHARNLVIMQLGRDGKSTTFPPEGRGMGGLQSLYNITVVDGLAHLTGHNYWGILNVQDPLKPEEIWNWEPPSHSGNPCNAVVGGNTAYIGCGWAGLFIFDITDPQSSLLLGSFKTPDWIIGMDVVGQVLYLTLGDSGLLSLDVSDPARPLLLDQINLPGFSTRVSVAEGVCYVIYSVFKDYVELESGVTAIDVSNPESLEIIAAYKDLNSGSDVQAIGKDIFITEELRGLTIFRLGMNE